jgi:hypothetical protein
MCNVTEFSHIQERKSEEGVEEYGATGDTWA